MRNIILPAALLLCALFIAPSPLAAQGRYENVSEKIDGIERTGIVYLPSTLRAGAPIVTCVHGYGGKANPKSYDLDPVAEREGFAVLYPQGLKDPSGHTGFNVGYPMQKGMNVDDVKAISRLTMYTVKKYGLSRVNVFLTGMSNGGDICYLTALRGHHPFRAMAPVAGLDFTWSHRLYYASNPPAVPMFEIHGTEDRVSEWTGDPEGKGGWGAYLPVPMAVGYWAARNGCVSERTDTVPSKDPHSTHYIIRHFYEGAPSGNDVQLYQVVGAPHCWHNQDIDTGEEIWKFFRKFVK